MDKTLSEKLKRLLLSAKLGYQPFRLSNGIEFGTGLQFFGLPNSDSLPQKGNSGGSLRRNASDHKGAELGNIFIPEHLRDEFPLAESNFYKPVTTENQIFFSQQNSLLRSLYEYFIDIVIEECNKRKVVLNSFVELGGNTGLFGFIAESRGLNATVVDIVDYGDAISLLAELTQSNPPVFYLLESQRSEDINKIPKADLGWSYAVALHQANPLIHLCDLSSLSKRAMLVMTPKTSIDEVENNDILCMQFVSSNSYYAAPFPQNFDVTLISESLLQFSLKETGFDEMIKISFPDFVPNSWKKKHCCYLALRNEVKEVSIYDFPRSPERVGTRAPDPDKISVDYRGDLANIVCFRNKYYVVPRGISFDEDFLFNNYGFPSFNRALSILIDEFQ